LRTTISGIEVEGTAEELGVLLRNYLKPTTTAAPAPVAASSTGLTCPACGQSGFKTQSTVRMHASHMKDEAHKKVGKEETSTGTNTCNECGRSFKKVQALHHHQSAVGHARREISSAAGSSSAPTGFSRVEEIEESNRTLDSITEAMIREKISLTAPQVDRHFTFVCMVGPTEVRHEINALTPTAAIADHDRSHPNHRFVTAYEEHKETRGRGHRLVPLLVTA
jgi:hypothetical protein